MAYQGHLDWPRGRELSGWVYDPARPGHRIQVEIFLDGAAVRTRIASNFRPDLKQAGIGDGCHAFSLELPEIIFDGRSHQMEARIGGQVFQSFAYQSKYSGSIDAVTQKTIRFSLRDESRPDFPVEAELYADGRFLAHGYEPAVFVPQGFSVAKVKRFELRARGCELTIAEKSAAGPPSTGFQQTEPVEGPVDVVVVAAGPAIVAMLRTLESIAASSNEAVMEVYAIPETADQAEALEEARQRLGFRIGPPAGESGHDRVHLTGGALVFGSWLDCLRKAAYLDADVATVSPLTGGPMDGHSARELNAVAQRVQPESYSLLDCPSNICHYAKATGGSVHLLAGGVRVEAMHPTAPSGDRHPEAARLRRTIEELRLPRNPAVQVLPEGSLLVEGLEYELPEDLDALARVVTSGRSGIQVDSALAPLALAGCGIPYQVEVKDYSWICPRGDLIDETGRYCGEPYLQACERCLRKLGPGDGLGGLLHRVSSVAELREQSRHLLDGAALVKFPSKDAAQRMSHYCSPRAAKIAEASPRKPAGLPAPSPVWRIRRFGEDTAIWQACIWDARKRELPLEFVIYGEAHAEWLPSEAPPLSVPDFTLYPVQFDIGAVAEGALRIPCGLPASRINDCLLQGLSS